MLIKLVRTSIKNQLQDARATAAQSNSELKFLQSQLSPPFPFQYPQQYLWHLLSRHEKVPPLLLKLSDLLRYSVYEAREQYVPLRSELDYIHNYIDSKRSGSAKSLFSLQNSNTISTPESKLPLLNDRIYRECFASMPRIVSSRKSLLTSN